MNGWTGNILHINLSTSEIKECSTKPYIDIYLGGRGIASKIYLETVSPSIKAFEPHNRLIMMTGPLVATGAQAATRMTIVAKSPMTYPEGFCYGNIGGFFPPYLKRAGYDGIVIEGRAPKPVYLFIKDMNVKIKDALDLWGQGTSKSGAFLKERHGNKTYYLTIGVAGENLVRSAVIVASHGSSATCGFGAVMGSKNLKAIAVKGAGKVAVADPEKLRELTRYTVHISKRVRLAIPPGVVATGRAELLEVIGKGACYQCGLECIRGVYRYGNKLEGSRKCQSQEFYLPWRYKKSDEPIETFFDAPSLANDYGIGTFELENIINWLYACYQSSALSKAETGLPLSKIGTREFLEKLLRTIAYREGFGEILGEGIVRAAANVSDNARVKLKPYMVSVGNSDLVPARAFIVHALLYPMEPRVSQPIIHENGFLYGTWLMNEFISPEISPVTTKVYHNVAKRFWGNEKAGDVSSYEGKALAAVKIQNRTYIKDCLGLCDFAWPITYSFNTPDNVGDPNLEAKTFSAVTGVDGGDFERYGQVVCNLQREILLREGRKTPRDDYPAEFNFNQPLSPDNHFMVPGPDNKAVDVSGNKLDREKFSKILKEYYALREWDGETGKPKADNVFA